MDKKPIITLKGIVHPSSPYEKRSERPLYPTKHALFDFTKKKNFKIALRCEHDPHKIVGWIDKFHIDKELNLCSDRIFVTDEETARKVKSGSLPFMSVGMLHKNPEYDECGAVNQFNVTCFYEVSLVSEPAFKECMIQEWKDFDVRTESEGNSF